MARCFVPAEITRLLNLAADQFAEDYAVDTVIQAQLADQGYLLSALQTDIDSILDARDELEIA